MEKISFNSGRAPPTSRGIFHAKFTAMWPTEFEPVTSPSRSTSSNHCTTQSHVSISHFGSSHIILNRV
jgi:hypothetical protein